LEGKDIALKFKLLFTVLTLFFSTTISSATFSEYWLNKKGIESYDNGQTEEAISAFSESLSKNDHGEVYNNLGNVFFKENDLEKSESMYLHALDRFKGDKKAKVYYNLGNIAYSKGDLNKAFDSYKESLIINSEDIDAKINLEIVLQKMMQQAPSQNEQEKNEEKDKEKEKEKEKREEQEKKDKEENAQRILNVMDQKEKEARENNRKTTSLKIKVDKDW